MPQPAHALRPPRLPRASLWLAAALSFAVLGTAAHAATGTQHNAGTKQKRSQPAGLDIDAFNTAQDTPLLRRGSNGMPVVRAQILLDRAWYSSGEIDGRFGANMERMVRAFQIAREIKPTGSVTPETWDLLRQDSEPLLARYTI